jgi:hypothetical protein
LIRGGFLKLRGARRRTEEVCCRLCFENEEDKYVELPRSEDLENIIYMKNVAKHE